MFVSDLPLPLAAFVLVRGCLDRFAPNREARLGGRFGHDCLCGKDIRRYQPAEQFPIFLISSGLAERVTAFEC